MKERKKSPMISMNCFSRHIFSSSALAPEKKVVLKHTHTWQKRKEASRKINFDAENERTKRNSDIRAQIN